ncbi:hypothetical protein DESME_02180 [Desulfitobacterium metallireducens DSM 15288]|uniref:Uncharacterized protein n=1 Tax=Desulfitobacterium metallireducens DSM 15288 TaxID=871968 RepID=W0EFW9_9FIRM|nr:hypothetical protein DESME_02180 [Desulfitobacterium metallireducens DSM 15288]
MRTVSYNVLGFPTRLNRMHHPLSVGNALLSEAAANISIHNPKSLYEFYLKIIKLCQIKSEYKNLI